jgi:hypothetical protein
MLRAWLACTVVPCTVIGCNDDLPKATDIERMRVLGSQISVVGDETRATPRPGEDVRITFATVFPDLDGTTDDAQTMVLGCTAPDRFTGGIPICQEFIDAATSGDLDVGSLLAMPQKVHCSDIPGRRLTVQGVTIACVDGPPVVQLPIKDSFEAARAMFIGVVCERGRAFIDPEQPGLFGCDDNDGETLAIHNTYPVQQSDEDENHNPLAADLTLEAHAFIELQPLDATLQEEPGPAEELPPLPEENCLDVYEDFGLQLRRVDRGVKALTVRYPAAAREEVNGEAEPVEITIHTTGGEIERRFTVFTDDTEPGRDGLLEGVLDWRPDKNPPRSGELVRFFVTVRDQRGGFDMSTYAVCVQ